MVDFYKYRTIKDKYERKMISKKEYKPINNELHEIKEQTIRNILSSKKVYYIRYKNKIERKEKKWL